jgi:hypothetical protein
MAEGCVALAAAGAFCCAAVAEAGQAFPIRVGVGYCNSLGEEFGGVRVTNHRSTAQLTCDSSSTVILRQLPDGGSIRGCNAANQQ